MLLCAREDRNLFLSGSAVSSAFLTTTKAMLGVEGPLRCCQSVPSVSRLLESLSFANQLETATFLSRRHYSFLCSPLLAAFLSVVEACKAVKDRRCLPSLSLSATWLELEARLFCILVMRSSRIQHPHGRFLASSFACFYSSSAGASPCLTESPTDHGTSILRCENVPTPCRPWERSG